MSNLTDFLIKSQFTLYIKYYTAPKIHKITHTNKKKIFKFKL